jgi:hypothetical protein
MGLKNSEHIGNIIIDPTNPRTVYVAAYGPIWSDGGDRGLYKSTNGGETWDKILDISKYTELSEFNKYLSSVGAPYMSGVLPMVD